MSIATYPELLGAIADWLARPGDPIVTSVAPDLVRLAEARINFGSGDAGSELFSPPLRVRQMEERATALVSGAYATLPPDFAELRDIKIDTAPERKLAYVTPPHFASLAAATSVGIPGIYTLVGDEIRFGPAPAAGGPVTVELHYYAKVPTLSVAAPTNWLLAAAPNVYLFGALVEAAPYIGDDAQLAKWFGLFSAAVSGLQAQDRRARHGGAPLSMRPLAPTP